MLTATMTAAVSITAPMVFAQSASPGAGYWHTAGNTILDSNGLQVRIAGINWYGFETPDYLAHGLWAQDYKTILNNIKSRGYNVVRIPFSNQMVESNPVPTNFTQYVNGAPANQALVGATALQDLDTIVSYAGSIGLRVILDNHRSEAGQSNESNGLWYTASYSDANWIADWQTMARRYSDSKFAVGGNPVVVGMDLRNEPHLIGASATSGACWTGDSSVNGCPTSQTTQNWPAAATRAGNAILAINPHLLIFVEGTDCYNGVCGWQGGNLTGVATYPVVLSTANQLAYSAHDYGPNLYGQPWFNSSTTPSSLDAIWNKYWGYISANGTAPVWLGEFGTGNNNTDITNTAAGSQGQWFQSLIDYLHTNAQINWTYWALNGEDAYGLLDSNYDAAPVNSLKQSALARIQYPLGGGSTTPSFTLWASAPSISMTQSSSATDTISVTDQGGFTGAVTLSISGLPSGVTASFSTNPTTSSSALQLIASNAAATGTANLTITGSSGSQTATTNIPLTINPANAGSVGCHVTYTVTSQWPGGFGVVLGIQNTGSVSLQAWTLTWSFPNGQTVTQLWNGSETQSGANVTVNNLSYNGTITPGATYSGVGFNGTWNNIANGAPASFAVNGTTCN